MADLHLSFQEFYKLISPTGDQMAALEKARNAVRERIRHHFQDVVKIQAPKFRSQGAWAMGTLIRPGNGEFDIDDGVYLQHLDKHTRFSWPAPEVVHLWMYSALDGHTYAAPVSKRTCLRVRDAGRYRVNLPAYAEMNGRFYLAECGAKGWHRSDPMALVHWFGAGMKSYGEQLRRVVRYLKAWSDFQAVRLGRMIGGTVLMVLGVRHYYPHERDDVALAMTLDAIEGQARSLLYVIHPMNSGEDLTARWTVSEHLRFQEALAAAASAADRAIQTTCPNESAGIWRDLFGDRFPVADRSGSHR